MKHVELIQFTIGGMHLQEPMALVTNWLISFFCFFAFIKLRGRNFEEVNYWKYFFLTFSISTFLAGFGHVFFQYWGIPGKFPNWILGILSGYFASNAMLIKFGAKSFVSNIKIGIVIKATVFLFLALWKQNFVFIAVDAILTYLIFCGVIAYIHFRRGFTEMKFMIFGVLVCLPSAFIFLLKINPHKWLNKDDLSHLLMLGCTICFYLGAQKLSFEKLSHTTK